MWIPSIRSLIFGHTLPKGEARKNFYLKKLADHFKFNTDYSENSVLQILRSAHVLNVKLFKDALIEYGYLEEDLYISGRYRRLK